MNIYFTRHGETDWNKESIILGRTDMALNQNGIRQAAELARRIASECEIEVIFSSPLVRAFDTAKSIAAATGAEVIADPRLREWDYGEYEGKSRDFNNFQDAKAEFGVRVGKSGESLLQLAHRVFSCLDSIVSQTDYNNVLIVSHGGVGRMVEAYFNDLTVHQFRNMFPENCCLKLYKKHTIISH